MPFPPTTSRGDCHAGSPGRRRPLAAALFQGSSRVKAPLSREREAELAAQIQQGDLLARDELVQANLRFVVDDQASADMELLHDSVRKVLQGLLRDLGDREAGILNRYYGLDGEEALTLEQIGAGLGLTRERVRQLKERALERLRHPARASALLALAGGDGPLC